MAKGLLGTKIGMMGMWDKNGKYIAVTALKCGPCSILQVKTPDKDGYSAVQIGFGKIKEENLSKAEKGHQKKAFEATGIYVRHAIELRDFPDAAEVGKQLDLSMFAEGDRVYVTSFSKGRGFQGVVKRHGFGGGRKSHGSTFHRAPGSVGAGTDPSEVVKGKRLPGRQGGKKTTIVNMKVVRIIPEENLMLVQGSVPGAAGSSVYVYQK